MAMSLPQSEHQGPLWRPDDHEYHTVAPNGIPIRLYWSEMTRTQKLLQIEAEQRAEYAVEFGIYQ